MAKFEISWYICHFVILSWNQRSGFLSLSCSHQTCIICNLFVVCNEPRRNNLKLLLMFCEYTFWTGANNANVSASGTAVIGISIVNTHGKRALVSSTLKIVYPQRTISLLIWRKSIYWGCACVTQLFTNHIGFFLRFPVLSADPAPSVITINLNKAFSGWQSSN